jgi:predicted RNA-binding Zn ribbon-like protein
MNKNSDPFVARGFGDSASWLDFVNSELLDGFGIRTDMLDDSTWLRSYMRYWKFRLPLQGPPLKELRTLRSQLRRLVEKAASSGRLGMADLEALNVWLKIPAIPQLEEDQNGLHLALVPVQSGWSSVLANISTSFATTLIEHAHDRLKICSNEDCRWIFVDGTKGNVRCWCSSKTCGNRERVRRARAANKS